MITKNICILPIPTGRAEVVNKTDKTEQTYYVTQVKKDW